MSLGGLVGAGIGGVIGFFIGGPMGAVYGAGIGLGVGTMIDPMTPDSPTIGAPSPEKAVMSSEIGNPCPDLSGSGKITGHLICYGGERTEAIYSTPSSSGGKGGPPEPEPQITGFNYYMSWVLGFCVGPVDTLLAVYKNDDDLLWEGPLDCPASAGKETIVIDGLGSVDFYFGTADQVANTKVGALLEDANYNTPYRHFCWALFDDCLIGKYPRTPTISIVVRKIPSVPFSSTNIIQEYDCNPMATLYYTLHDLAGLPEEWFDLDEFSTLAFNLRKEYRGISTVFQDQQSALAYTHSIMNHIDGLLRYGSDGKFHPKLIRDDYTVSELPIIDEDDLLEEPSLLRPAWIDTSNEIKVQFSEIYDVERSKTFYGSLYYFGLNGYYQNVANGGAALHSHSPTLVPDIEDWKIEKVCNNMHQTVIFRDDGLVFTRGANSFGECGQGVSTYIADWGQPEVGYDSPGYWATFAPNFTNLFGLTTLGDLYACGRNGTDFLNTGLSTDPLRHLTIDQDGVAFDLIAAGWGSGSGHRIAFGGVSFNNTYVTPNITSNLVGGGGAYYGELGYGANISNMQSWSGLLNGSISNVIGIWCGNAMSYYGFGIEDNFEVYSAGVNSDGRLGIGNWVNQNLWQLVLGGPWKSFDCGTSHAVGIKTDGTMWGCGLNDYYQLGQGLGDITNRNVMTKMSDKTDWIKCQANANGSYGLDSSGRVYGCGFNEYGQAGQTAGIRVYELTQEETQDHWVNIFKHGGGLFLLK